MGSYCHLHAGYARPQSPNLEAVDFVLANDLEALEQLDGRSQARILSKLSGSTIPARAAPRLTTALLDYDATPLLEYPALLEVAHRRWSPGDFYDALVATGRYSALFYLETVYGLRAGLRAELLDKARERGFEADVRALEALDATY